MTAVMGGRARRHEEASRLLARLAARRFERLAAVPPDRGE